MVITDGLISYYKLDGDATDVLGTNNGTATNVSWAAGKINNGGSFNGGSSQIYKDSASFDFYGTQNITFSCWVKLTVMPSAAGNYCSPIGIQETSQPGTIDKTFRIYGDGRVGFYVWDGAAKETISSTGTITINNRYNLVGVYNGTNAILYVNGTYIGAVAASGTFNFTSPRLVLSQVPGGVGTQYLNGLIDEVGIRNRALTQDEITQLYNGGSGISYPFLFLYGIANEPTRTRYRNELGQIDGGTIPAMVERYRKRGKLGQIDAVGAYEDSSSDIVITAVITQANQRVKVNQYFGNVHTINRGDGTATANHTADTTHTYTSPGTYEITLSLGSGVSRWTFTSVVKQLVPKSGTTASNVYISQMPSLADWFGESATSVGERFFSYFNRHGALTSLPAGSFDTGNITSVGDYFFRNFNNSGALTSLPADSFNTSNITTAGSFFFFNFNSSGALTSLPAGSFDTGNITTVGNEFFASFNSSGALTSLPAGSFDTSNITSVGSYFFSSFNNLGKITKSASGVTIKNASSGNVAFHYWNGSSSVSESISRGGTFTAYTSS